MSKDGPRGGTDPRDFLFQGLSPDRKVGTFLPHISVVKVLRIGTRGGCPKLTDLVMSRVFRLYFTRVHLNSKNLVS